jgi:glycosyltransferase involved in cell wall biosynthesis
MASSRTSSPFVPEPSVAVLIPCHNEEASVGEVVTAFRKALPTATVYVYDNNSTDATVALAAQAGAVIRRERRQGKGYVVQRMFADTDADVYVMVDGDGTYDAAAAPTMVNMLLTDGLDLVTGVRKPVSHDSEVYRRGHTLGNRLFNAIGRLLFGGAITDIFSGYRVMSRRFVKSFPLTSSGFEVETELTVHAVEIGAPCAELETAYSPRKEESPSKLRTYRDGGRVLRIALIFFKELYPLRFFGALFTAFAVAGLTLGISVLADFLRTGLVLRFPSAILSAAMLTLAFIFLTCGFVVASVSRGRREARRLAYLAIPAWEVGSRLDVGLSSPVDGKEVRVHATSQRPE